jgi:CDP-diacylglycerol---glycerol-3-phosphate 3-phosphatidyltransferase
MKFVILPKIVKDGFIHLLQPVVNSFVKHQLNPNLLSSLSLIISLVAAIFYARGVIFVAGIFLLLGGIFDMVDGSVARASNRVTRFGALLDSTLDRYSEIFVFFGMGIYFVNTYEATTEGILLIMAVFSAIAGSVMVSYVRARAEGLGFECKVGVMQRPERVVLLGLGSLIGESALIIAVVIVAVLANLTAVQRIYHIWAADGLKKWKKLPPNVGHE